MLSPELNGNRRVRAGVRSGVILVLLAGFGSWNAGQPGQALADVIHLRGGGQLRGELERSQENARQGVIAIRTLSGARVVIDRRQVERTERRSARVEQYETAARQLPDTVDAHWQMANWCQTQSLVDQRDFHLQRLLALDPNHVPAHKILGHRQHDGQWLTEEEYMEAQGYVRHGGRFITPEQRDLLEQGEADAEQEREWYRKIRIWKKWLALNSPSRQSEALFELRSIDDPLAVGGLKKNFEDEANAQLRHLYVSVLGQIQGTVPIGPLVEAYLIETDYEVQSLAMTVLKSRDRKAVLEAVVPYLRNDVNEIVCRAGRLLEHVGNESIVPNLIDALVTRHVYRVQVPDNSGAMTFGTDGTSVRGGALPGELATAIQAGQFPNGVIVRQPAEKPIRWRTVAITRDHQNSEVLRALQKITGRDFGFESGNWRLWWTSQKNTVN